MGAVNIDIIFEQNVPRQVILEDWQNADGTPYELSQLTAVLQIRRHWQAANVLIELSSENQQIVIDLVNRQIVASFEPEDIENLKPLSGLPEQGQFRAGVWELQVFDSSGTPYSVAKGRVYLSMGVVR